MKKLTNKQTKFIDEYFIDLNATQAAIRSGYSKKTARKIGQENLTKPDILNAIKQRRKELSDATKINQERILNEEKSIAFFDLGKLFKTDGSLIPLGELPEEVRRGISGFEIIETPILGTKKIKRTYKYKLNDKGRSLERVGKHLGMYSEKIERGLTKEVLILFLNCLPERFRDGVERELEKIIASR